MTEVDPQMLIEGMQTGGIIPYLGPGVLADVTECGSGRPIPADSDSLIIAMNNGKPMSPRLMYEFPRAAMDVELKRGRGAVHRFLDKTYAQTQWTRSAVHDWLQRVRPHYIVDINRDTQLQQSYADLPHTLVRGVSRIAGTDYRFRIHSYDGRRYSDREIAQTEVDPSLPILFKPMGSPVPDPTYVASDADFVDYISELMGGFAIPDFVKAYRRGRQYLLIGVRMTRDTERMVLSDIIYDAGSPAGWVVLPDATDKERRFCARIGLKILDFDLPALLDASAPDPTPLRTSTATHDVGC